MDILEELKNESEKIELIGQKYGNISISVSAGRESKYRNVTFIDGDEVCTYDTKDEMFSWYSQSKNENKDISKQAFIKWLETRQDKKRDGIC